MARDYGAVAFRAVRSQLREGSRCPTCQLPKLRINAKVKGFSAEPHCVCAKDLTVRKALGSLTEVRAIIEQRLRPSVMLDVVPRDQAALFPNQLLLESTDGEYLVTIIKTRRSRRK